MLWTRTESVKRDLCAGYFLIKREMRCGFVFRPLDTDTLSVRKDLDCVDLRYHNACNALCSFV